MLPTLHSLSVSPCDGLDDLTAHFGSEKESLPQDCRTVEVSDRPVHQLSSYRITLDAYRKNLRNPDFVPGAIRMALVIGSFIFTINHGDAFLKHEMTRSRWISASLSFVTPYLVSIYGQTQCQMRSRKHHLSP